MHELPEQTVIAGFDFSTGSVKGLAFALDGAVLSEIRLPTELWTADGVSELELTHIKDQVQAAICGLADELRGIGRLDDWAAIGISATHHTSGRIDALGLQVRRAICWNDQTLSKYHAQGLSRLGGTENVRKLIGGPWAPRYSLSHLVKDEQHLSPADWARTRWILPHGSLVTGYMTERFDAISVSSAASTGMMDLRSDQWQTEMFNALASKEFRRLAEQHLPRIVHATEPIGPIAEYLAVEANLTSRTLVYPTNDDQQAGLVGGGCVDAGDLAIILGNSAVVNSSSANLPNAGDLDAMKLNWGPYLWMRCFNNGAQFLDLIAGTNPNWEQLERDAAHEPAGCSGIRVMPFAMPEPSCAIDRPWMEWTPSEPTSPGVRWRAALEALAYLVARGVREHELAGQRIVQVVVSGGIARSRLMCEILASVIDRPVRVLKSTEGPALGAAVATLWALINDHRRRNQITTPFAIRDAVAAMVQYRETIHPNSRWMSIYQRERTEFDRRVDNARSGSLKGT